MNIVIPIKQVPDSNKVKMDPESGTMIREGVDAVVNPLDLYSIELGVQLKKNYGGTITVISMGPPKAVKAIREAISMGCDEGILLSDKKFGGSDTWATSYVLSEAIKNIPSYDLIIFGERATDGDTGQVGPSTAAWLGLPLASYVASVDAVNEDSLEVERMIEGGYQQIRLPMPSVLTVVKEIADPMLPTLSGKKRARRTEIPTYTSETLPFEDSKLGLKGSPTRVVKIRTPKVSREGRVVRAVEEEEIDTALDELISFLKEKELV